jgi:hypothetical protein
MGQEGPNPFLTGVQGPRCSSTFQKARNDMAPFDGECKAYVSGRMFRVEYYGDEGR